LISTGHQEEPVISSGGLIATGQYKVNSQRSIGSYEEVNENIDSFKNQNKEMYEKLQMNSNTITSDVIVAGQT
jgi:hypothetical protein